MKDQILEKLDRYKKKNNKTFSESINKKKLSSHELDELFLF